MVTESRGIVPGGGEPNQLREALQGTPVQRAAQQARTDTNQPQQTTDRATLSEQIRVNLRQANDQMQTVQERIVVNRMANDGLTAIRDEISNLRAELSQQLNQQGQIDAISQTINNINQLSETIQFQGVPVLDDLNAEGLGMTRILPEGPQTVEMGQIEQVLNAAEDQVLDRMDEVQQETTVERQRLEQIQVGMENMTAAMRGTDRATENQDIERAVEAVQREGGRRGQEMNLTPDRVLELI